LLPRLPDSEKPDFFCKLIEQQSPGPYLEVFARRLRPGWDAWGNEVECTIQLPGMPANLDARLSSPVE
jgi:N6-adenosine-specific RNA methylase IME4